MQNLKKVKLGDLVERITSGGTPSTSIKEYYGGEIPWLKTQEINFNRIYKTETFITHEGLKNSSAKLIKENSVIIAMYGNTAAKVAINKIPLSTNQACCNITVDPLKADYRYIYYYFLKEYESLKSLANGGAQQNLNAAIIRNYEIELPELSIQSRIASILSSLDEKIELNRRTNQTLEQIAQTLFKKYFVDDIDPENLPKGWRLGKIGEIYKTTSGGTPSRTRLEYYEFGIIRWVKSKELEGSFILETEEMITDEALNNSSAKLLPTHSVLVAMYGATVGEIAILGVEAACNQAICAIIPNKDYPYTYVFLILSMNKDKLVNKASGSAQQNISQLVIQNFELVIPPVEIIMNFHLLANELFCKIENNLNENIQLTKIRDLLLPKLISGEIEFESNEFDKIINDN